MIVPIYNESDGKFIGIWAQNRSFTPTFGSLSELMSLAEPTLIALTKRPVKRTENYGVNHVGTNVGFQDGVFLMIDGEPTPIKDFKNGKSFIAISLKGIPIVKRLS